MIDPNDAQSGQATTPSPNSHLNLTNARPTRVRHVIVGVTAFAAFLMYLDRVCISQMVVNDKLKSDLNLDTNSVSTILGIFFFAYALGQVPGGWLADRFRTRSLLALLIGIWSGFTLMTGFAVGFWSLIIARIGCGLAEAGAYPASGKLVPRWVPLLNRGRANAVISAGGRFGGAVAPILTALTTALVIQVWGFQFVSTWRTPGRVFGGVGVAFAFIFWIVYRNRPSEHPRCNLAERQLIEKDLPPADFSDTKSPPRTPWRALLSSRDMWLMCLYQFLTNVGWAFLITSMPTFLKDMYPAGDKGSAESWNSLLNWMPAFLKDAFPKGAKGSADIVAGSMSSTALLAGLVGMLAGGWLTDSLTAKFGLRRGRMIPMAWSRVAGAVAYLLCLRFSSAWACVAAFGVVAAMTDISIPATWGYIQDVGGRNVATMFGWPNMWGNFGAGLTPLMLNWINGRFDPHPHDPHPHYNWSALLIFLAVAFLLSGFVALGIRADVKIDDVPQPPAGA